MSTMQRDRARNDLLEYLYHKFTKARSRKSQTATVGEIKKGLKPKGYKENDIMQALTFLIDRGWVTEQKETRQITLKWGPKTVEKVRYRITDTGVEHFEGQSSFESSDRYRGINITNIHGITVVGQHNVVQTKFSGLYEALDSLGEQVRSNGQISDQEKLVYQADIDTIKTQLAKPEPKREIIKAVWESLSKLATIGGVVGMFQKVAELIRPILGI
jgi:hypothetical protein